MSTKSKASLVDRKGSNVAPPQQPANGEIQRRAYFIYIDRGATDGWDVEDWLQSEYELNREYELSQKEERIKLGTKPAAKGLPVPAR